ncbi:MAG: hypothetical protein CL431_08580 [Acidimicrobiaceae bacterium]|nr:hypothetical protein [Acidimicrobiaceae bacterium]|tara:strand:- start:66190 stop:66957 length:768 start_codon:yes stop_codon:yes gene_type:complete
MDTIDNSIIIVTGAAQGLGKAIAKRLVEDGCNVSITDQNPKVKETAELIGADAFIGNVGDPNHVKSVVDSVISTHGKIDILVNNAGEVFPTGPTDDWEKTIEMFDRIFTSNTKGAYLFGRAVATSMILNNSGHIINVSTDHVKPSPNSARHHGHGNMDLYNASKWALNGLTFDWAKSLAKYNIRVNNLCVGATDTEMLRKWSGQNADPEWVKSWMRPEDVAGVLLEIIKEGPTGRTGDNVGLYAGFDCVLPPAET